MNALNEGTMALFCIVPLDSNKNTSQCLDKCISDLLDTVLLHLLPGITQRELNFYRNEFVVRDFVTKIDLSHKQGF